MNHVNRTKHFAIGPPLALLALGLLTMVGASQVAIAAEDEPRVSITTQGVKAEHGSILETKASRDEYKALTLSGSRDKASAGGKQKSSANESATPNTYFWFYAVDVELFADRDRDGYFSGIDLLFDADTYYDIADVYAVIYLSYEYGPWNEYAETDDFTIFGASSEDEYIVETDLVAGYPTGNYDILIELYDAYDNSLVATIGPEDTSELGILPLEDSDRDTPAGATQIVVSSGGGGSLSWFLLLGLGAALARRS